MYFKALIYYNYCVICYNDSNYHSINKIECFKAGGERLEEELLQRMR